MAVPHFPRPNQPSRELMHAAVYTRFGPPEVIRVETLLRPEPRPDEIRVRVLATTVTAACTMMRRGDTLMARVVLGMLGPRKRFQIAGIEFAGTVDRVGHAVGDFSLGDRVFGFAGFNVGAYGEYFCLPARASVAPMPAEIDFGQAASLVNGPTTALHFLRDLARVKVSDQVLVIGASGSVGGAAVQVARSLGARVTGVCSGANVELVRSLGAEEVIDYTRSDFTSNGQSYDVIFDAVTKSTFARCKRSLRPGGRYLPTVARAWDYFLMGWTKLSGNRRVICGMSVEKRRKLADVSELLSRGELKPVIDRRYRLDDIVEAHRYVDSGRKRVVIDMPAGAG